jgi:hypothetical protein
LPSTRTSWGLHAIAQREPGHPDTGFPYCLGPLATLSSDLAEVATSSPVADLLAQPYNGRPSDYYSQRCDHEDYSLYSAIDASAHSPPQELLQQQQQPIHVFHDCRFIEPFLQGEGFTKPTALMTTVGDGRRGTAATTGVPPFSPSRLVPHEFVNLHKLDKSLFAAARKWFTDTQEPQVPPTFVSHPSPDLPARYQWHSSEDALSNRCGPLFSANYHTRWGELGPMKFFLKREGELHPCPYQDLSTLMHPISIALGVWTRLPQERLELRRALRDVPSLWSWFNRSSTSPSVLLRFPIFQAAPITLDAYWECHRYQDMVAINGKWNFGGSTPGSRVVGSNTWKRYTWSMVASRLYPSAAFIAVLENSRPLMVNPLATVSRILLVTGGDIPLPSSSACWDWAKHPLNHTLGSQVLVAVGSHIKKLGSRRMCV